VAGGPMPLGYVIDEHGRQWRNPVLVVPRGTAMRVTLDNAIDAPTIVHWHGLTVDSRNDGNGFRLAAPGAKFDYAFPVANRAGTYWYHPHPHGLTAGQAHRGLFGVMLVDDAEDRALAAALGTTRGDTDLVLALCDRRSDARDRYAPARDDLVSGYLGDEMLVNGTSRPYLDVGTRGYRLRIVNAANARTFRLAFRGDDGAVLPFTLLGTDGGLLARPLACREVLVASAERIDVWIDFAGRALGDSVVMESLAFDPMHGERHGGHSAPAPAGATGTRRWRRGDDAWRARDAGTSDRGSGGDGTWIARDADDSARRVARRARRRRSPVAAAISRPHAHAGIAAATHDIVVAAVTARDGRRRGAIPPVVRQGPLAHQRPGLRHGRRAARRAAQHRADVAVPQLLHEHAAPDAPARLRLSRDRARAESRLPRPLATDD